MASIREQFDTYRDDELFEIWYSEKSYFRKQWIETRRKLVEKNEQISRLTARLATAKASRAYLLGNLLLSLKPPFKGFRKAYRSLTQRADTDRVAMPVECADDVVTTDSDSLVEEFLYSCDQDRDRHLILTSSYPDAVNLYAGSFLHNRVKKLVGAGLNCDVLRFTRNEAPALLEFDGVRLLRATSSVLRNVLARVNYRSISLHFITEEMWAALANFRDHPNCLVWLYGAEIQGWGRHLYLSESGREKDLQIRASERRSDFWREMFARQYTPRKYVFLSQWLCRAAAQDQGVTLDHKKVEVVHNFIDSELFGSTPKPEQQRFKILLIKNFSSPKYATDIAISAILGLQGTAVWRHLEIRILGDGDFFDEILRPVKGLPNVSIQRGFLMQSQIAEVQRHYGIFLCPTRMDTQGISRDEAMASGLVPATNRVGAVPEFVDDGCAILAPPEDHRALVEGIVRVASSAELFMLMSKRAMQRVREQSSYASTIAREIQLMCNPQTGEHLDRVA